VRRGRRRLTLPLSAWATGGVASTVVAVLLVTAIVLAQGGFSRVEMMAVLVGALVGLLATVGTLRWSRRVTTGLRALHGDAVRRLRDPSAAQVGGEQTRMGTVLASQELAGLARVMDALQLRARVADEVAEQARRSAESTSVGMFELLSGLVAAEEATRGQLSAELHDTAAQSLMAARSLLAGPGLSTEDRAKIREYVEDAEEQVRAVMARARPPELRDGDLASAVGALRSDMATRYLLQVRLVWPEEPHPLPLVSAVTIYRFFQEGLLNVVKHAEVDSAEAVLSIDGDGIVATVRDRGAGFDLGAVRPDGGRHVGLGLLRERVRLAGGALDIDSHPAAGTTLTLRLPMAPPGVPGLLGRG